MSPEQVNDETWLTYDEVAEKTGYSPETIRQMVNNNGREDAPFRDLSDFKRKMGRSAFVEESIVEELNDG